MATQALIVVDMQNGFLRQGNLASPRCLPALPAVETEFEGLLHRQHIDRVRVCGVRTDICVRYTIADLRNRDIAVAVPAAATFDARGHPDEVQASSLAHLRGILGATAEG